jgi:predicted O-linked N-acetylglucosamine transferase (SPINDLY family)
MTSHPRQRPFHQPSTQSSAPIRDADQPTGQLEAITHLKAGRLHEAAAAFERAIADDPGNWQSHQLLGLVAYRQGDRERAVQCIRHCLTINPVLAEAYSDLGVVLKDMGDLDGALAACEKAISLKPGFYPAHNNLGNIYKALRKLDDAADCYNRAIELSPEFADAYANLGAVLLLLDRKGDAIDASLKAVELAPNNADALTTFAQALLAINEIDDAIAICQRAVELRPDYGPAFSDLGRILQHANRFDEAIAAHKQALALKPDHAEAHNNLGIVYKDLARYSDALRAYRSAIELKPDYTDAYANMGVVLGQMGHSDDAMRAYRRALEIDPELLVAYINLASAYSENRLSEAIATYTKALTIDPGHLSTMVNHYHLRRRACDWDGLAAAEQKILASTFREGKRVAPFPILNMSSTVEDHLLAAREWVKGIRSPLGAALEHTPPRGAPGERRLRIGYLSNDFYRHATSSLIAELIELHDRSRFEVFGYCFTRDDGSDMRHRLVAAFDHFVTIGDLPHADAAARINKDRIDILIDLKGFTTGARTEILACRPAPIQINYLGYPATMGADYIDYIIADEFILPMDQQPFFDERIVHLPGCYQPNDSRRQIAENGPTRADCGLPDDAFVFCSFNNSYKITPEMFSIWMRLLQNAPGSVLWLLESNSLMRENLRRKAASLSVDPARLVFAPKMELSQHLARHRLADLFLDSLPVNAHTTASDALWAGVPVLTCSGETLVSRVCGSLLKAVGLGELITYSLSHYERLALDLAQDPGRLARLRNELAQNRRTAPLFDMERYRQGFEAALKHMVELRERGDEPRAFAVNEASNAAPEAETEALAPAAKVEREIPVIEAATCARRKRWWLPCRR